MLDLIVYAISALGLAYIVGHSKISLPFRQWIAGKSEFLVALLECPACFGFWTGIAYSILFSEAIWLEWPPSVIGKMLFAALFTSGSNFLLGHITGLISYEE